MINYMKIIFIVLIYSCCIPVSKGELQTESQISDIIIGKLLDTLPTLRFNCSKRISNSNYDTVFIDTSFYKPYISSYVEKVIVVGDDSMKFGELLNENNNCIKYKLNVERVRNKGFTKPFVLSNTSQLVDTMNNQSVLITFSGIMYNENYRWIEFRMQSGVVSSLYSAIVFIFDKNNSIIKIVGYEYKV